MIPALLAMTRTAAAAGGRSFAADAAASLVKGPQARANKDAAAEKSLNDEKVRSKKTNEDLGKSYQALRGRATEAVAQVYLLKAAFESLSGDMTGNLTAPIQALKSLADPIANLVQLSNPGQVKLFELAFNDAMAVVGRAGTGALGAFTRAMEKLGNTYARFEPVMTRVFDALGNGVEELFNVLLEHADEFAPVAEQLASAFVLMAKEAVMVARAVMYVNRVMSIFSLGFARAFGFTGDSLNKGATAKGSAIRDVKITDSAQDYARRAQEQAFQQAFAGGATKKEPTEVLPTMAVDINKLREHAKDIYDFLVAYVRAAGKFADKVLDTGAAGATGGIGSEVAGAIVDIARMFRSSRTD